MNSNTTEEQVKQKIESLTPLDAGIVFGREDAWDKLQARLDAKPIRKPVPVYRIAAAAALVLGLITLAIMYLNPKQNIASPDVMVRLSNHDISIGQDAPTSSPSPLERAGVRLDSFHTNNSISSAPAKPHHKQTITPPSPLPEPKSVAQAPQPTPDAVPSPAPTPAMKVIHINELGKEPAPVYEFAVKDIPHPHVMFRMKVIHINDLMKPISQDEYLREMQNNTAVRIPFFHRQVYDRPANDQPKSLFRINISN